MSPSDSRCKRLKPLGGANSRGALLAGGTELVLDCMVVEEATPTATVLGGVVVLVRMAAMRGVLKNGRPGEVAASAARGE